MRKYRAVLFGYPIEAGVTRLDDGVHVLLTGGCRSHIGAVSTAEPGKEPETKVFPGHKDQFISEPWAAAMAERTGQRAVVVCGVHYDDAGKGQIAEILRCTEKMLESVLADWAAE